MRRFTRKKCIASEIRLARRLLAVAAAALWLNNAVFAQDERDDPAQRYITPEVIREIGADAEGNYIVGDMVFNEPSLRAIQRAPDAVFSGNKWTGGSVYYTFDPDIEESKRERFREAATLWSQVSGVSFQESSSAGNRIRVVIPDDGVYCNSFVGMIGGEQVINLGDSMTATCWGRIGVAHEIGHALGLFHEQNRADRAPHVTVTNTGGGTAFCNSLITVNWGMASGSILTGYDFHSIMHYASNSSLSSANCPSGVTGTITAISAQPPGLPAGSEFVCQSPAECTSIMGNRAELSMRDGYGMALRYGYRIQSVISGNGNGSVSVSGQMEDCGSNCWLVSPQATFTVTATPTADSIATISGACSGRESCQFSPNANGSVRVTFIKKSTLVALTTIMRNVTDDEPEIFLNGFE